MVVNYSERLVTLLKDCRQLIEMGMSVSDKIRAAAADAEKFYRYGVMLKKVRRGVAVLCMTCGVCPHAVFIYGFLLLACPRSHPRVRPGCQLLQHHGVADHPLSKVHAAGAPVGVRAGGAETHRACSPRVHKSHLLRVAHIAECVLRPLRD
jgi:hypothetical protein